MPKSDDVITLRGTPTELTSDVGRAFIVDATRAGEGVITDEDLMTKWEISVEYLQSLANNKLIGRAIRSEREHRLRTGVAAKELANGYFVKAPAVLNGIMSNEQANARHRIESVRELRAIAVPENQSVPAQSDRFHITINLGSDVEVYDKSIAINANDEPPKLSPLLTVLPNEDSNE